MGSDSDMPIMSKAADILEELGIDFEMTVISAHREPDEFFQYAKSAEERGYKVIIAGRRQGSASAGYVRRYLSDAGDRRSDEDLRSWRGGFSVFHRTDADRYPVATVAINGAANAGILAAKILATSDAALLDRLKAYSEKLKNQVVEKADKLASIGYKEYLKQM